VLEYHLAAGCGIQDNDVLVERLNPAAESDAVDQVDACERLFRHEGLQEVVLNGGLILHVVSGGSNALALYRY